MPAAAVPVGASVIGSELAAPAIAGALGAGVPAWISGAAGSALMGGIGSYIMGQDPLRGALLGGIGGGIMSGMGGMQGIGDTFKNMLPGATPDAAASVAGNALGDAPALANAPGINLSMAGAGAGATPANLFTDAAQANGIFGASPVASAPTSAAAPAASGFMGKMGTLAPYLGVGALAYGADKIMAGADGPPPAEDSGPARKPMPLNRRYTGAVDPTSYLGNNANRTFYNDVNPITQYYGCGGSVARMAAGGKTKGPGDGMSDNIPAMLSDGEYVIKAPVVSALGNGSNDAGARKLDKLQKKVDAKHYRGPPKSAMGLSSYMR